MSDKAYSKMTPKEQRASKAGMMSAYKRRKKHDAMKKIGMAIIAVMLIASTACAEWVNGYTKRNGTYVGGYNRSDRDSTVTNNYSFSGNTNPYTGAVGTNRYTSSSSSPYFNQGSSRSYNPNVINQVGND